MIYAETIYMDSTTTFPTGKIYDRMVVIEDTTLTTLATTYEVGNTEVLATEAQIIDITAGMVLPGGITNVVVASGKILLSRG